MNSNYSSKDNDVIEERKKKRKMEREQKKILQDKIIDQFRLHYTDMVQEILIDTESWEMKREKKDCDLVKEHGHIEVEEFNITFNSTVTITAKNLKDQQQYTESSTKKIDRIFHPRGSSFTDEQMNINIALMEIDEQKFMVYQKMINIATNDKK